MKLMTFRARYGTDEACRGHLQSVRWPHAPVCDRCRSIDHASAETKCLQVPCARNGFPRRVGRLMEDSHLALRTWRLALCLILPTSKTISSVNLAQHLSLGQETA